MGSKRHRYGPLWWGLGLMSLCFIALNLGPYLFLAKLAQDVEMELVQVLGETGEPVDMLSRGRTISRQAARTVAEFFGLGTGETATEGEQFVIEVQFQNRGNRDLFLLKMDYRFEVEGQVVATGFFERSKPQALKRNKPKRLLFPLALTVSGKELDRRLNRSGVGVVIGDAWLVLGNLEFKVPFAQPIDLDGAL